MSVVLRCPTCGTTQGHAGECEACSEGEVRYFCTNHDDGVWLDGPACSRCGAKFGDAPKKPPAPRPPAVPPRPTRPAGTPDFRPPRRPEPARPAEPEVLPRTPSLGELLEEITGERARARARYEIEEVPWTERRAEPRRPGFPLAGCLVRVAGLVFLLIAAAIIFLFLLFSGFIVD